MENITYKHFKNNKITMYHNSILVCQAILSDVNQPAVFLQHLDTAVGYLNRGYGTLLMKEIFNRFKDKEAISLQVAIKNTGAIRLYRRLGFHVAYTTSGKRWYVMTKKL